MNETQVLQAWILIPSLFLLFWTMDQKKVNRGNFIMGSLFVFLMASSPLIKIVSLWYMGGQFLTSAKPNTDQFILLLPESLFWVVLFEMAVISFSIAAKGGDNKVGHIVVPLHHVFWRGIKYTIVLMVVFGGVWQLFGLPIVKGLMLGLHLGLLSALLLILHGTWCGFHASVPQEKECQDTNQSNNQ